MHRKTPKENPEEGFVQFLILFVTIIKMVAFSVFSVFIQHLLLSCLSMEGKLLHNNLVNILNQIA